MFPDQKEFEITAKTFSGLENVLADEIKSIGGKGVQVGIRSVKFIGNKALVYKANVVLRTCLKLLVPIHTFTARNENDLYRNVKNVDWSKYLEPLDTFAIDSAVSSHHFKHSQYVIHKTKDAIVDQFRDRSGTRPSVNTERPNLRINIHIQNDKATISLDSSGDSLHKRGYRIGRHKAPLNEVLAAGMVILSGWEGNTEFIDPMCGSGTIPIEAAMIAYNIAPNANRTRFGFSSWKDYDYGLLDEIKEEAFLHRRSFDHFIIGSDKLDQAVRSAKENVVGAELGGKIDISKCKIQDSQPMSDTGIIIMNPPYGERLQEDEINQFYTMIGDTLKNKYSGFDAWILSSNKEAMKNIGLKTSKKLTLYNGQLECKFHKYSLYKGSKK